MTAAILPFPLRHRTDTDAETLRQTRALIEECWRLREECKRIRHQYEARQKLIDAALRELERQADVQALRDAWGHL